MSYRCLEHHLTDKIKETQLVQHILTMSSTSLPGEIQRDIRSFAFTWSIFNYIYVPWASQVVSENMPDISEDKIKWSIYNDILKIIHKLIRQYKIQRNPIVKIYAPKINYYPRDYDEERFSIYWCHCILSSWGSHSLSGIGCAMIRESLEENEMRYLIQKFLLRFQCTHRLLFLREIGIFSLLCDLSS